MNFILLCFTCVASLPMILATLTNLEVKPRKIRLLEGEQVTALCSVKEPISKCEWSVGYPYNFLDLKPKAKLPEGIEYHGRGLEYGECGIKIPKVTEQDKLIICRILPLGNNFTKVQGYVRLFVAKEPSAPEITVTRINAAKNNYPPNTFKENETIRAECTAESGQASANIFWYMGTEEIGDGVSPLVVGDVGWKTMTMNLTKILQHSDNGKDLRCVAHHIAVGYDNGFSNVRTLSSEATYPLNVYFKPKLISIEKRTFMIGQPGKVKFTILANPRPTIEWLVDREKIREGSNDETGRFYAANLTMTDEMTWTSELQIEQIKPRDARKSYTITARNQLGELKYRIGNRFVKAVPSSANVAISAAPFINITNPESSSNG